MNTVRDRRRRSPLGGTPHWRRLLTVVTAVFATIALAACGGSSSDTGGSGSGSGGEAGGDRLTVATAATPTTLDPEFASSPQDREVDISVYDRFLKLADDGQGSADLEAEPEPQLAESWTVSDDGRVFEFKLREGVQSFYGNELTAEDVIWSWDRVFDQQSHGLFALGVSSVEADSYTAVDDYTIRVELETPNPLLPSVLATPIPGAVIYDSTEVQKHATPDDKWGSNWLANNTASFGPYHVQDFTPGQQVTLVANPNYYGDALALEEVILREIPDPANRLALLRSGEVDIAQDLNSELRRSLEGQAGVKVESQPGNLAIAFGLNNEMPPFDDVRVRQAVAMAVPVNDIIETVYFNDETARLFNGYVADNFPGYPDYWPYEGQDIEEAKRLVEAAGATGSRVELSYTTTFLEHEKIAQFITAALKEIGLEAVPNKLTPAKYEEQYYSHQAQSVLVQDASFVPDSVFPLYLFFGQDQGAVGNWINYTNKPVQDEIDRALAIPDLAERAEAALEVQKQIIDEAPWAMYLGIGYHLAMREDVQGFIWRPHNSLRFSDLSK